MLERDYSVIQGAWEWVGFAVEINGIVFINEGLVGRSRNPLKWSKRTVEGGWYFPPTTLTRLDTAIAVDILLEMPTDKLYALVREEDDIYDGSRFELMIPLMRRWSSDDEWEVARPVYKEGFHETP